MQDLKPERAVELDGSWHFVGAQGDRADPLDHGQNSPALFPCAVCSRHFSTGLHEPDAVSSLSVSQSRGRLAALESWCPSSKEAIRRLAEQIVLASVSLIP